MKLNVKCKIDMSGFRNLRDRVVRIARKDTSGDAALEELDRSWMRRVRQFVADHFAKSSQGGGDWTALAEATMKARAREVNAIREAHGQKPLKLARTKGGEVSPRRNPNSVSLGGGKFPILDANGTLRDAVSSLDDGSSIIQEASPLLGRGGLLFVGGEADGGILTSELAAIHQQGNDRMPPREIIPEELDEDCKAGMMEDLQEAIKRIKEETKIK